MKKALSIILTVLLVASIGCNVYLFMTYKSTLNALTDAKSETATISASLSEKESAITEANTKITELETTIADLQSQITKVKALVDEKEKELEAAKESAKADATDEIESISNPETTPVVTDDMINDIVNDIVGKPSGGGGGQATAPVPEGWSTELHDDSEIPDNNPGVLPSNPDLAGGQIDR